MTIIINITTVAVHRSTSIHKSGRYHLEHILFILTLILQHNIVDNIYCFGTI